jgi:hypothetical protein
VLGGSCTIIAVIWQRELGQPRVWRHYHPGGPGSFGAALSAVVRDPRIVQLSSALSRILPSSKASGALLMRRRTALRLKLAALLVPVIGLLVANATPIRIFAADDPKPPVAADQAPKAKNPVPEAPRPAQRLGDKVLALGLWIAIVVVGLALLSVVMVWGRRLRRLARGKPRSPTAPDPLWYLKTKPPGSPAAAGPAPTDSSRRSDGDPGSDVSGQTPL